jgi:cytochrome c556
MSKPSFAHTFLLTILSLGITQLAFAGGHNSENPAAEYRSQVMETLGSSMSSLVDVLTGKVEAPGHLQVHAATLARSAELVADLFPEGSQGGDALPLIWEEPDKLAEAAQAAVDATAALAVAADSGDRAATMQAFRGVGDSCKGCHERYKKEDD